MALTPEPFDFGPWAVGDAITGPAAVPYLEGDEPADFTGLPLLGTLTDPLGLAVPVDMNVDAADPSVLVYYLPGDPFTLDGLHTLTATITAAVGTFRTPEASFLVEAVDGWATVGGMRAEWRDAPRSDVHLWRLLESARVQVEAYARDVDVLVGARPSTSLVDAQKLQARNIWNASKTDPTNEGIGDEGFIIRPARMDATVKQLIRPVKAKPVVR